MIYKRVLIPFTEHAGKDITVIIDEHNIVIDIITKTAPLPSNLHIGNKLYYGWIKEEIVSRDEYPEYFL